MEIFRSGDRPEDPVGQFKDISSIFLNMTEQVGVFGRGTESIRDEALVHSQPGSHRFDRKPLPFNKHSVTIVMIADATSIHEALIVPAGYDWNFAHATTIVLTEYPVI